MTDVHLARYTRCTIDTTYVSCPDGPMTGAYIGQECIPKADVIRVCESLFTALKGTGWDKDALWVMPVPTKDQLVRRTADLLANLSITGPGLIPDDRPLVRLVDHLRSGRRIQATLSLAELKAMQSGRVLQYDPWAYCPIEAGALDLLSDIDDEGDPTPAIERALLEQGVRYPDVLIRQWINVAWTTAGRARRPWPR